MLTRHPFKSNKGSTVVDYLMVTAVVAGIMIPIVSKYFAEPLLKSFQGNKQNLVQFIAQTPKRSVPNAWFASERAAQMKAPPNIDGGPPIEAPPDIDAPPDINPPKDIANPPIKGAKDIPPPPNIKPVGNLGGNGGIAPPGDISAGSGSATGNTFGAGAGSPDFFSAGNDKQAKDAANKGEEAGGSTVGYRRAGGGDDEYSPGGGGGGGAGGKKEKATKEEDVKERNNATLESRRKAIQVMGEVEQEERARANPFDWWMVIKILIVLLIMFLILVIGLSNMKKR